MNGDLAAAVDAGEAERQTAAGRPLRHWLNQRAGAQSVHVRRMAPLTGGAIHDNWALDLHFESGPMAGDHCLVLRRSARRPVAECRSRAQEFAILEAVWAAGLCVPEPLWCCADRDVFERDFFIMRRVDGVASAHRIWSDPTVGGPRQMLARQLASTLAEIHAITPPHAGLEVLDAPQPVPAEAALVRMRAALDERPRPYPALEWALDWLSRRVSPASTVTLTHRDFRTGNYAVNAHGLTVILDWDFADWSDPTEDIAWFCARCWRRGAWKLEAGGIADRAVFYGAYEAASGRRIDPDAVHWWEVMAHIRWAVIALQQADRHLSGAEPGLERALLGRRLAEIEYEVLSMTGAA